MSTWPSTFYRTTKHKKPLFQIYQPGFNSHNGCWLDGDWISLRQEEWESRKDDHDKMYKAAANDKAKQHHSNEGVKRESMTEAQRQAWEHFSGTPVLDSVFPKGIGSVSLRTAGPRLTSKSEKWLRENGVKLVRWVKKNDKVYSQLEGYDIPEDLIAEEGSNSNEPVDVWRRIVMQNIERMDNTFYDCVRVLERNEGSVTTIKVAFEAVGNHLLDLEDSVLRMEKKASQGEEPDRFRTLEDEVKRYVKLYNHLKASLLKGGHFKGDIDVFDKFLVLRRLQRRKDAQFKIPRPNVNGILG